MSIIISHTFYGIFSNFVTVICNPSTKVTTRVALNMTLCGTFRIMFTYAVTNVSVRLTEKGTETIIINN